MYNKNFRLTGANGNNSFSYDIRTNKTLHVPSIINGGLSDIQLGTQPVFEDLDEYGILRSCSGLENFVRMEWKGIPMIVFDNHNHALYFWYEALSEGIIGKKNTLAHIDEHSDLWENKNCIPTGASLNDIFNFTNYACNVGNYIQPAIQSGIIEKVLRIEDTIGMEKYASYKKDGSESIILNLDLDFFAPELDYIGFEDKKSTILNFAHQAKLITVATSPFFIDQKRAIEMLMKVFECTKE